MGDEAKHAQHAATLIDHAGDMVTDEDRLQASEKIWGTVAHTLKSIAEKYGWQNETHADLVGIAEYLKEVADEEEIGVRFGHAQSFHRNFYEDERSMDSIRGGLRSAERLVVLLEDAERKYAEGALPYNGAKSPHDYLSRVKAPT